MLKSCLDYFFSFCVSFKRNGLFLVIVCSDLYFLFFCSSRGLMYAVIKSVEEIGRVFLMNEVLSYTGIGVSRTPLLWNGIFTYCINKGYSPFKSGVFSGYLAGDSRNYLNRSVRGGISGVGIAITNKLSQYLLQRISR